MEEFLRSINHGFRLRSEGGVRFLSIPSFDATGKVRHCFTTRVGGVSEGCYASLNLSRTRESSKKNKEENYRRVCQVLDCNYDDLTIVNYSHGDGIYHTTKGDAGKGISKPSDLPFCDALIIKDRGVVGVTLHADCVPVFFLGCTKKHSLC